MILIHWLSMMLNQPTHHQTSKNKKREPPDCGSRPGLWTAASHPKAGRFCFSGWRRHPVHTGTIEDFCPHGQRPHRPSRCRNAWTTEMLCYHQTCRRNTWQTSSDGNRAFKLHHHPELLYQYGSQPDGGISQLNGGLSDPQTSRKFARFCAVQLKIG